GGPQIVFTKLKQPRSLPLASPAVTLSFNPSATSSLQRQHLLVADARGAIRILDCCGAGAAPRWLVSLYMGYSARAPARKRIVGAEWCAGGNAVMVLAADGEVGVFCALEQARYVV